MIYQSGIGDGAGSTVVIVVMVLVVVSVLVAGFFLFRLLTKFRLVHGELMPAGAKIAFWGALAYTLLPIDLLADPILLDDIAVLVMALTWINRLASSISDTQPPPSGPAARSGDIIDVDGRPVQNQPPDPLDNRWIIPPQTDHPD